MPPFFYTWGNTMKKRIAVASLLFLSQAMAQAGEDLVVTHQLLNASPVGDQLELTFSLAIENRGLHQLSNLRLESAGYEFTGSPQQHRINIAQLPANAISENIWTARTHYEPAYFSGNTPLFFDMQAKTETGDTITLPVYSLGKE